MGLSSKAGKKKHEHEIKTKPDHWTELDAMSRSNASQEQKMNGKDLSVRSTFEKGLFKMD